VRNRGDTEGAAETKYRTEGWTGTGGRTGGKEKSEVNKEQCREGGVSGEHVLASHRPEGTLVIRKGKKRRSRARTQEEGSRKGGEGRRGFCISASVQVAVCARRRKELTK